MNEELLNKIIETAYGNASVADKIKIYFLAYKNSEVKKVLMDYKATADKVKNLGIENCPDHLINNISKTIKSENINSHSLLSDIYNILFNRPILSGTLAAVFILAVLSTFIFNRPEIKQQYTKQQIEQADAEVKYSLSLVANVLNKTKSTIENDVLQEKVNKPIKESLFIINDYINGENKNENIN